MIDDYEPSPDAEPTVEEPEEQAPVGPVAQLPDFDLGESVLTDLERQIGQQARQLAFYRAAIAKRDQLIRANTHLLGERALEFLA